MGGAVAMQFDTLDYARRLAQTGVPLGQAEEQSKLLAEVLGKSVALPLDVLALEKKVCNRFDLSEVKSSARFDGIESKLGGRIDKLEGRVDKLDGRMAQLEGRMCKLEGRMDKLEGRMDKLESRMDQLEKLIHELNLTFSARFAVLEGQGVLSRWMASLSLAMNIAILLKVFFP